MMKNILFIGETGVGKSSVTNLIVGTDVAPVSSNVERGTFSTTRYAYGNFCLFDTIGYNDVEEKNPTEALTNLAKFAMNASTEGISLIVYVMKKGRINKVSRKNYDYFVKTFCKNEVPVLLVVTHCEDEGVLGKWYHSQEAKFIEYNMRFADVVCGCAADLSNPDLDPDMLPIYRRKRDRTQELLRKKIEALALNVPWKPSNSGEWLVNIFKGAIIILGITAVAIAAATAPLTGALGAAAVTAISKVVPR